MRLKWTVGQQIAAGFALVLVLMAFLIAMALQNTQQFMETSDRVQHTHRVLTTLEQVLSLMKDAETGQRGYVLTGQEPFLEPYNHALASLQKSLDELRTLMADNPEQQRHLEALRTPVGQKLAELQGVIDTRRQQGLEAAQALVAGGRGKALMDDIRSRLAEMRQAEEQLLEAREQRAEAGAHLLTSTLQSGAALALALVVVCALFIIRSLRHQIGSAIAQVQSASAELQAAATQQASGAREQSSATTQVSVTIKELLSTARQIAGNAQQVTRVADDTAGAARGGNETVGRAQEAIEQVRRQVDVIVNHMLELGKRSQEIGGILDIINELAEQTNILAINATIESAGAGEHGRRFAAVAEEIRKLADRVGRSTKDIRSLIDEIRAAANTTIMATEDGSKAVQHSARQFTEVAGNFRDIADMVRSSLEVAREIELSTQQQVTAVEQVSTALQDMAQTARESEVGSAQTLQTATQLIHLSRQLNTLIERAAA